MKKTAIILLSLVVFGCKKEEVKLTNNYTPPVHYYGYAHFEWSNIFIKSVSVELNGSTLQYTNTDGRGSGSADFQTIVGKYPYRVNIAYKDSSKVINGEVEVKKDLINKVYL